MLIMRHGTLLGEDPDWRAFKARLGPVDDLQNAAGNLFIQTLKAEGIWERTDVFQFGPLGTADNRAGLNWRKNEWNGTLTDMAEAGGSISQSAPGGVWDTGFNPSTAVGANYTQDDAGILISMSGVAAELAADIGDDTASDRLCFFARYTDDNGYYAINTNSARANSSGFSSPITGSGDFFLTRYDASTVELWKLSTGGGTASLVSSATTASNGVPTSTIVIPADDGLGNIDTEKAFAYVWIGASLSQSQFEALEFAIFTLNNENWEPPA